MLSRRCAVISIVMLACSDPSPPDGPGTPDACVRYARTTCERRQACGAGWFELEHGTRAACEEHVARACVERRDAADSGLTAEILDGCTEELAAATCVTVLDPDLSRCRSRGARADQRACLHDDQCAGGDCHRELNSNLCGSCRSLGDVGAACSPDPDDGESCAEGLHCMGSPGTCQPAPISLEGETCAASSFRRCASTLFCNARDVCVRPLAADAACTELLGECDIAQRLFCDPEVKRCRTIPIHRAGESCIPVGEPGGALCGSGLSCGADFICAAPLALGAACDDSAACGPGLGCASTNTCVALSDLTCAGGAIDPGDGGGGGPRFAFDIPNATLAIDCTASTGTLEYVARYHNQLPQAHEARVEGVTVSIGGGPGLVFAITPNTSGSVAAGTAIAVNHAGSGAVPDDICLTCPALADLEVVISVEGVGQAFTTQMPVTCTLD